MSRAEFTYNKTTFDFAIDIITIISLLALILIPIIAYTQLPERIPTHYGVDGTADGFGSKNSIFFLPLLGLGIFGLFKWLGRYPHKFNYPHQITDENRGQSYSMALKMMNTLNAMIVSSFAYITYSTVRTAAGDQSGLGQAFIPIFIILNLAISGFYLYRSVINND